MELGNLVETVMYYLIIGGMTDLGYWDGFPMVSVVVCMVTHWIRLTISDYYSKSVIL